MEPIFSALGSPGKNRGGHRFVLISMMRSGAFSTSLLLTALVAFGPVSTDLYLPSLPAMTKAFGTNVAQVQLTLSIFIAGFAVSQIIFGPLSDRFGRRPILLIGLWVYFIASIGAVFVESIDALIIWRFVQGVGAGSGPVLARAVVRDLYEGDAAARVLSFMSSAMALAPLVAPILGGQLQVHFGWQANFVALAIFGGAILIASWKILNETNRHLDNQAINPLRLGANCLGLLRHSGFLGYTLVVSFSYAGLFCFISGSSFVLIDILKVPTELFGFSFAAVVAGYATGSFVTGKLTRYWGIPKLIAWGSVMALGAGGLLASLAWAGVETLLAIIIPMPMIFFSLGFCLPTGTAAALRPFPQIAGSASALLGFIQLSTGALAGAAVGLLHDGTTRPMATVMVVLLLAAVIAFYGLANRVEQA